MADTVTSTSSADASGSDPLREPSPSLTAPVAPRPRLPLPRWLAPLAGVCAAALLPWTIYLAMTLPRHTRAAHYNVAWVGFDVGMLLLLAALGWAAWKRRPYVSPLASAAATMLIIDAWFDVVTASHSADFWQAVVSACALELPLAAVCVWVAVNAERIRMRAYRRLWARAAAPCAEDVERITAR